uniref:Coiled-coil domain containing 68 n=1 Tax=Calidris pygmaea TaxID=425635 RepID=A0A8C3J488_9CHAR
MKPAPLSPLARAEQRKARIVMTTLLLTEQITREDHGSEGNYVLYGSSCSQITEEAEYVRKQHPQVSGNREEAESWSRSPVATTMKETEEQLLVVSRENQVLKIKLEATREAGVQALRSASQKLYENYQARSEELKKSQESEKKQIQAYNLQQEEKLRQSSEDANHLAEGIREKCTRITEMEQRLQRMEEEKKTLMEKKMSFEKMLQQMMSRNEDGKRCLDLQRKISTLQEQICHLQGVIQAQHQGLRSVIQEVRTGRCWALVFSVCAGEEQRCLGLGTPHSICISALGLVDEKLHAPWQPTRLWGDAPLSAASSSGATNSRRTWSCWSQRCWEGWSPSAGRGG